MLDWKSIKKHNMKAKIPMFFILFYFEMGGIKGLKNVKGGMYQKRLGTTDLTRCLHL